MALMLLAGERHESETDRAVQGCNDYLRMGPGRSQRKLLKKYQRGSTAKSPRITPPTRNVDTIKNWSAKFGWPARASAYDAEREAERNVKRQEVFEKGLALDYERVTKLKRLAINLEKQIYETIDGTLPGFEQHKLWLRDVKQVGSGEEAQRVDIVRFNSALLEQYRAVLADLAAEVGDRKQRQEHSGSVITEIVIDYAEKDIDFAEAP